MAPLSEPDPRSPFAARPSHLRLVGGTDVLDTEVDDVTVDGPAADSPIPDCMPENASMPAADGVPVHRVPMWLWVLATFAANILAIPMALGELAALPRKFSAAYAARPG